MNKLLVVFFVTSVAAENFQKYISAHPQLAEDNYFFTINEHLQNVINEVFTCMAINRNFTQISKIRLLLVMHENLRSIAENSFKIYNEVVNATATQFNNKTENALFNLTRVIDEIFQERHTVFPSNSKTEHIIDDNEEKSLLDVTNKTSVESLEFIGDFLKKIDTLTLEDLVGPNKTNYSNGTDPAAPTGSLLKLMQSYDLKVWSPTLQEDLANLTFADTRRIYRGKRGHIKKYPFVASFHMMGEFLCGGSIISKDLVLTAASCLQVALNDRMYQKNPNVLTVRVGSDYTNRLGDVVPITEIYFHPSYDATYLKNNLAIGRMKRHLVFKKQNRKIRRIEYDRLHAKLPEEGGSIIMLGWGDKDKLDKGEGSPLSFARLDIYKLDACKEIYTQNFVNDNNFCAGYIHVGSGACNRDVGGPAIIGSRLVGVISFGPPVCGTPDAPTVFSKLGYYADWIDGIVHKVPLYTSGKNSVLRGGLNTEKAVDKNKINAKPKKVITAEIQILRKLFKDLILTGNLEIDDILYDVDGDEMKDFWATKKVELQNHPLVNKSLFLLPGVHDIPAEENEPVLVADMLATPPVESTMYPDQYPDDVENIKRLFDDDDDSQISDGGSEVQTTKGFQSTSGMPEFEKVVRYDNDLSDTKESENDEEDEDYKFSYKLNDDSGEDGLSIEVPKQTYHRKQGVKTAKYFDESQVVHDRDIRKETKKVSNRKHKFRKVDRDRIVPKGERLFFATADIAPGISVIPHGFKVTPLNFKAQIKEPYFGEKKKGQDRGVEISGEDDGEEDGGKVAANADINQFDVVADASFGENRRLLDYVNI